MKFRKKPVVIEAWLWTGDATAMPDFLKHHRQWSINWSNMATIQTLTDRTTVTKGDWIIKSAEDELYSCRPGIFEATYERIDE